jgi:pimeloyl-ACP methyl ester carboxylesterase
MRIGLAFLALALACALIPASALAAKTPKGDAFYEPPTPLTGKKHGDVIWSRPMPAKKGLKAAATQRYLLYRSESLGGDPVAVSGFMLTPKGKAPKGGWPVVSFGHGTTGIADKCAPSKYKITSGDYGKNAIGPLWSGYLKAGYAVVQTDYEGLGTPGDHPYLMGGSEGRGILDLVRAARKSDKKIGKRVLLAGHSQGGHGALWAASIASEWTPELKILGSQAFAPIANVSIIAQAAEGFTQPGGLAPYAGLLTRAFDAVVPTFEPADWLTEPAMALYPDGATKCLDEMFAADSWGGISLADALRDDVNRDEFIGLFREYADMDDFSLPGHVLILHGTADTTVPVALSDALEGDLKDAGTKVEYKKYEGETHSGVVEAGRKAALADAKKRLK